MDGAEKHHRYRVSKIGQRSKRMIKSTKEFEGLKKHFDNLESFCIENRGKTIPWADDRKLLRRYLEFCHLTGKVATLTSHGKIDTVIFWWPDFLEHIEAKHENKISQFEWAPMKNNGDAIFISDIIGRHYGVKQIAASAVALNPQMVSMPKYTYRHGKLLKISNKLFTRAVFGKQ